MHVQPIPTGPRGARGRLATVASILAPVAVLVVVVALAWPEDRGDPSRRSAADPSPSRTQDAPGTDLATPRRPSLVTMPPREVRAEDLPERVVGVPILALETLLAERRAGRLGGSLVAVSGYLTMDPRARRCSADAPPDEHDFCWRAGILATRPDSLLRLARDDSGSIQWIGNPGPHLHPQVLPGSTLPDLLVAPRHGPGTDGMIEPVHVVLIGRFGDPRAEACGVGRRQGHCGEEFVLERVVWASSQWQPRSLARDPSVPADQVHFRTAAALAIGTRYDRDGLLVLGEAIVPLERLRQIHPRAAEAIGTHDDGPIWYVRAVLLQLEGDDQLLWMAVELQTGRILAADVEGAASAPEDAEATGTPSG